MVGFLTLVLFVGLPAAALIAGVTCMISDVVEDNKAPPGFPDSDGL